MNIGNGGGNRGEHITPSSRRSIHWHENYCPFVSGEENMGRYGLERNSPQKYNVVSPKLADAGRDEIDNVQSKLARPASPMPIRQNQKQRRNSSDAQGSDNSYDESERLSKSLPEKFPSHLYCSEDSDTEQNVLEMSNGSHYQSFESKQSTSRRAHDDLSHENYKYERQCAEQMPRLERQIQHLQTKAQNKDMSNKFWHIYIPVIVGIILAICYYSDWPDKTPNILKSGKSYDKLTFYNDMSAIGEFYNLNQDSILQLQVGISSISEKEDTDSFIFVYNSNKHNFNSTVFNEFVNEIAAASARYLRNESLSVRHVVVDSSNIVVKDTSELIHKYSDDIVKGGVMVMREIEMLPSSLAMALHYYCDVFNPLVKKSAIFFTLDMANCSDKISTHAHIEKCLKNKWNGVSSEYIGPLLARVVSVVVDVTALF